MTAESQARTVRAAWTASLVMVAGVFFADYRTGDELSLSLLYLVPISIAAWWCGRRAGLLLAGLAAAGWFTSYLLIGRLFSSASITLWNFAVEAGTDATVALAVSGWRTALDRQRALTGQLELAYRRLDREQLLVGEFQRTMLPAHAPEVAGVRIAVHYETSARAGGDYYDFFPLADGRVGILIADASGHGTPAAVLMAMTRALLHASPEAPDSPADVLERLNRQLLRNVTPGQFITAFYAVLDPRSGDLLYSLAGHNPPYLNRADGSLESLADGGGPPLGVLESARFASERIRLDAGDTVLLYTDGLTEAMGPGEQLFGEDQVRDILSDSSSLTPESLIARLLGAVCAHRGDMKASDDVTLIVMQADVEPERALVPGIQSMVARS